MRDLQTVATRGDQAEFWYATSEFSPGALARMRADDWTAVVWWDDVKPPGLRVYEIGPRFADLANYHAPH